MAQFSNRWGHLKLASPNILIAINLGFESNFNMCETMQQSNGLLIFTNRHFLKANIETYFQGLDFRTGGATLYQKSTGGMPPVPPALTEALIRIKIACKGYKNFRYTECDSKFTLNWHLLSHIASIHERKRNIECQICNGKFLLFSHLRVHISTINEGRKSFECKLCDRKYK